MLIFQMLFLMITVDDEDILEVINQLKPKLSLRVDGISTFIIKKLLLFIRPRS